MAPAKTKAIIGGKVISPKAIASYPHLFSPDNYDPAKPKFKITLLFDLSNPQVVEGLKAMKAELKALAVKAFGAQSPEVLTFGKPGGALKLPFRSGDELAAAGKGEIHKGKIVVTAGSARRPGVCGPKCELITVESDIYAGAIVRASLIPATYKQQSSNGISFWLNNVQKVADGEPIAGGSSNAADDFGDTGDTGAKEEGFADEDDNMGF